MLCKMRGLEIVGTNYKSHMSIYDVNYIVRRRDTCLLKLEGNSFHFRAALYLYGCGSGGCRSEESRLECGEWQCGSLALGIFREGLPSLTPPLCMSELKMSHSFIQRHGVGRSGKARTPGEPSTVRTLTDYII